MFIIEKIIEQIVIQKNGDDPDPNSVIASINVQALMDQLTNLEQIKEQETKYSKLLEKSRKLEKELSQLQTLKKTDSIRRNDTPLRENIPYPSIAELKNFVQENFEANNSNLYQQLIAAIVCSLINF